MLSARPVEVAEPGRQLRLCYRIDIRAQIIHICTHCEGYLPHGLPAQIEYHPPYGRRTATAYNGSLVLVRQPSPGDEWLPRPPRRTSLCHVTTAHGCSQVHPVAPGLSELTSMLMKQMTSNSHYHQPGLALRGGRRPCCCRERGRGASAGPAVLRVGLKRAGKSRRASCAALAALVGRFD